MGYDVDHKKDGTENGLRSRAYQLEMYHDSLQRNIIVGKHVATPWMITRECTADRSGVAMDTGSGKTHMSAVTG